MEKEIKRTIVSVGLLIAFLVLFQACHEKQLVTSPPEISEVTVFTSKLSVTSPERWETWYMERTYEIRWKPTKEVRFVKMELVRKLKPKLTIIPSIQNTGYFKWTIPTTIYPSRHYRIKITDLENPEIVNYSDEFTIKEL